MENNIFTYIVQSKDNNLIKKSSSGGMFAELAKYVLAQNGIVFGCAMERIENGFDVKHIYIEDEKDLYKLQGSKYVQSKLGNTIKQAKDFLETGRLVLFSGTPCQIAGLKSYLKQDYEKLITVDLSCEGTPPLKIFNDYIEYLEKNVIKSEILDFKFRSKKHFGWSTSGFVAIYKKGSKIKEKVLPQNLSSYFTSFLKGDILQDRCFYCKFSGINRISDITIADAWGAENEYHDVLKSKFCISNGISLVLINSDKGNFFLEKVSPELNKNKIDINRLLKYNHPFRHPSRKSNTREELLREYEKFGYEGIEKFYKKNIGKRYYYYIIKNHTPNFIKNIIKFVKPKKIDCLLMTLYCLNNYGSLLTAYALYKTIKNLGYKSQLIHYGNISAYNKNFIEKHLPLTSRCINTKDLRKLNNIADTFILGSDNLINLKTNPLDNVVQNLFNFTDEHKKRIMFAGSIGSWNGSTKSKQDYDYIKYLLNRFDYVSTREEHGKNVFETVYDVNADWINDPVFYLQKQDYLELIKDIKQNYSDKIMQYVLYPSENTKKIVNYYKNSLASDIIKFDGNENVEFFSTYKTKTVEHWLSAIVNSKLIITDSFHCIAFCLIFNKQFICIKNSHATVRFTSLFNKLGINIPLIECVEDLNKDNLYYDIKKVNQELESIRINALEKIQKRLLEPKKQIIHNIKMEEYNKNFMKKNTKWYKQNKLFYYTIIILFVIPIKRIWKNKKNEHN